MRLPPIDNRPAEWPQPVIDSWQDLTEQAKQMEAQMGESDAFERTLATFRDMVSTGRFDGLRPLLQRRLAARALTWLWLNDQVCGPRLLNVRMLDTLLEAQHPRLTRLTLVQLIQLYFRFFDQLDEHDKHSEVGLCERLQAHLLEQLRRIPEQRHPFPRKDVLSVLKADGAWLLDLDGPLNLVRQVRQQGTELAQAFSDHGLEGFDTGRYGDICRAHYYLETLRGLPLGEWHEVLDELLKPSVSKAPYEGGKRIGHAALEIMIDRVADDPGDAWQNFILTLAGDPRIASTASNYRQWWQPLGEARIAKVRGWLCKLDLRLFLQALEEYGKETRNNDLMRMFPARKKFLEGLEEQKLIRYSRLLLGNQALHTVKKLLDQSLQSSYALMDGSMSDKAVIYLNCGDFHLVEGSHNFRIWAYLAEPGKSLMNYDKTTFSHYDLIHGLPAIYHKLYPALPYEAVTHNGNWQGKVIGFLANQGIGLDIEKLFTPEDYRAFLLCEGIPYINPNKIVVPTPQTLEEAEPQKRVTTREIPFAEPPASRFAPKPAPHTSSSSPLASAALMPSSAAPLRSDRDSSSAATPPSDTPSVARSIREQNRAIAEARGTGQAGSQTREAAAGRGSMIPRSRKLNEAEATLVKKIGQLSEPALDVLRYFAANPRDKARYAGNVLGMDVREVNRLLYGPLKNLCTQDGSSGWIVSPEVEEILPRLFP
ncbi:EH signature domain-containing protein [Azotobacter salinestris]|uniref:EH signature domain-containing protein n=1 Tax=Azotobacter salinestris TaxID=69964 RepID=UPI0032DFFB9B